MTVGAFDYGNALGGGTHGGHWNALATAQSRAAQAAYLAYQRTGTLHPAQRAASAIEDAGIRAGEIIGVRVWRVRRELDGTLRLLSMATDTVWHPGEPMRGEPKDAGVHAFKERKRAAYTYSGYAPFVIGAVALWGEVIEHEMGYRAEFGQVESLDEIIGGPVSVLEELRALYIANRTPTTDDRPDQKPDGDLS